MRLLSGAMRREVKDEIYETCIRVAYPGQQASLPEFINSVDEVVEDSIGGVEQRILDTYQPARPQESDSDVDDICRISYKVALKTYVSSVLNIPISIRRKVSSSRLCYIKRSRILRLYK